jgi:hypothetical protein
MGHGGQGCGTKEKDMPASSTDDRPPSMQEITAARRAERAGDDAAAGRPRRHVDAGMLPGIIAIVIAVASAIALWMIS